MLEGSGKGFSMTHNVSWQDLYADAMLELDRVRLQEKIDAAETAIRHSIQELSGRGALGAEEIQALSSALGNLQTLQRVEFRKRISDAQSLTPAEG
jgi:hypothetical protein